MTSEASGSAFIPFKDYVAQFEIPNDVAVKPPQTHMWMSNSIKEKAYKKDGTEYDRGRTLLLHVPNQCRDEFYKRLFDYLCSTQNHTLQSRYIGDNCFTEKLYNVNKFRFFVDIDFSVELLQDDTLSNDTSELVQQMSHTVNLVHKQVAKAYGEDAVSEWYLSMRVPYKLHVHFPNIITNKDYASVVRDKIVEEMKTDVITGPLIAREEKAIDDSVYNNGLRMIGMHKGRMIRDYEGEKKKIAIHSKHLPDIPYYQTYRLVDPQTFESLHMPFELFEKLSIHVTDNNLELTPCSYPTRQQLKGKGKQRATPPAGPVVLASKGELDHAIDRLDVDTISDLLESESEKDIQGMFKHTLEWVALQFNRVIVADKAKMWQGMTLVIPLITTECPIINAMHKSNRQFILVDMNGARQKCHDCKKVAGKVVFFSRLPSKVRDELKSAGLVRSIDMTPRRQQQDGGGVLCKTEKPADHKELVKTVLNEFEGEVGAWYNVKDISEDNYRVWGGNVCIPLKELYCVVCNVNHSSPSNFIFMDPMGKTCIQCKESKDFMPFPNPPFTPTNELMKSFLNVNMTNVFIKNTLNLQLTVNDHSGDVDVLFEEINIWPDDPKLNHLVFESFTGNTFQLVKLMHYLAGNRFCCTKDGTWCVYEGHRWRTDAEHKMYCFVSEELTQYIREARDVYLEHTADQDIAKRRCHKLNDLIDNLNTFSFKKNVVNEASMYFYSHDLYYDPEEDAHFESRLDTAKNLLGFTDGVFDLDTMQFRNGEPDDCITMTCKYQFPRSSDPELRAQLLQFIDDIQPDPEIRDYMLTHLASALHGENNQEIFTIYTGKGRNGKSKLQDLIEFALGDYFFSVKAEMFTREQPGAESPTAAIINLKGKRVVIASEPSPNEKLKSAFIKLITGNDNLTGRKLNSNTIQKFKPQLQLIILANDIPAMDSTDGATITRTRILPFPTTFCHKPERSHEKLIDENLSSKLPKWRDEFLLLLLEYYQRYKTQNKKLVAPAQVMEVVNQYKFENNYVEQFLSECAEPSDKWYSVKNFYTAFVAWYTQNVGRHGCMDNLGFKRALSHVSITDRRYCNDTKSQQLGVQYRLKSEELEVDVDELVASASV